MTKLPALAFASVLVSSLAAPAVAEPWTVDPSHTVVSFEVDHLGMSAIVARFDEFQASFDLDTAAPANSSVEFTIQIGSLDSGFAPRDEHFLSADFFDADTYPTATFKSTSVSVTGEDTAEVTGELTIKDVTRTVTLDVALNGQMDDHPLMEGTQPYAGFSATTSFPRADFGIDTYSGIGDTVDIRIEMESTGPAT